MLFLGFTPVFTAVAQGMYAWQHLLLLLVIGCLVHVFTFVQNDYYDIVVDTQSIYVAQRPLVSAQITRKKAQLIYFISLLILLVLSIFFFSLLSLGSLILSLICITIYNKFSKRTPGMEYILGLGVFFIALFGAFTVEDPISMFAVLLSLFAFFQWLFSVGISANLKDVEFDSQLKIKTTPTLFGTYVHKKELMIPLAFKIYAIVIKLIHITTIFLVFYLGYSSLFINDVPLPGLCFLFLACSLLYLTIKILTTTDIHNRDMMLRYAGVQEGLVLLLVPISMMSILLENLGIIPLIVVILVLIIWPFFWFRFLFGKRLLPFE